MNGMIREVMWEKRHRIGRWSFWLRGTDQRGPKMLQHHCRGTERSELVDRVDGVVILWKCGKCGAKAPNFVVAVWNRRPYSAFWHS